MQWYLTRHAAMQQDDGTADLPAGRNTRRQTEENNRTG